MFYNSLRCRPSALVEIIGRSLGSVHQSSSIAVLKAALQEQLDTIEQAGTLITERIVTSKQAPEIRVAGCRNPVLNFCANNYLGLSSHPEVIQAAVEAMKKYGAGMSSTRFMGGTHELHIELEKKIAKFHGREDAILYASCYDANAGFFEVVLNADDVVLS